MGTGYAATKWNPTRNRKGLANNFRRSKPTIHTDDQSPIKENLPPRTSPSRACSPSPFITRSPSDSSRKHTNHHFTKSSITSSDQVLIQKLRADSFQRQLHNERKKVTRARDTQMQLKGRINDLEDNLKGATSSSSKLLDVMGRELDAAKQALEKTTTDLHQSKLRSASLAHDKDILKKRVKRIPDRVETAVKRAVASFSTQSLKDKGIITDRVRECVRELISDNVPMEKVSSIIHTVATTFGVTLDDDLTSRSVGRIVREGGIIARCQIVDIVKQSEGVTVGGDGTSRKNLNYESRTMTATDPTTGKKKVYFLGNTTAPNHTSEAQLHGWEELVDEMYKQYNASPKGESEPLDYRTFFTTTLGMVTDHANDQKKLVKLFAEMKQRFDREMRGERAIKLVTPSEILRRLCDLNEQKFEKAGGQAKFDALPFEEQHRQNLLITQELIIFYGEKEFAQLSEEQQKEVDFFVWGGCCMHKDLNAHKGGVARMMLYWDENGILGPVLLMNKDNAAAAEFGDSAAKSRAEKVSTRGAVKLAELMGMLLNHKDPKKGHHDTHGIYFEAREHVGYFVRFPDTSNTRYQCFSDAAAEIIVHLPIYKEFMEFARDHKKSLKFNHMESNVHKALQCDATMTEVCALTLYGQSISIPYARQARRGELKNLLELGPLHDKVIQHCRRVVASPELVCGLSASYITGSLDGEIWERPEAVYAVLRLAPDLPHLRGIVQAFFEGALETWIRFASEFAEGSVISGMSAKMKDRAFLPSTNDANEGNLGKVIVDLRGASNASQQWLNSKSMYKQNGGKRYAQDNLTGEKNSQFLRAEERKENASGSSKRQRTVLAAAQVATAASNRSEQADRDKHKEDKRDAVDACTPVLDLVWLENSDNHRSITVAQIDLQLNWHRAREIERSRDKKTQVPSTTKLKKHEKLPVLINAVVRWNGRNRAEDVHMNAPDGLDALGDDRSVESDQESDDIDYREG